MVSPSYLSLVSAERGASQAGTGAGEHHRVGPSFSWVTASTTLTGFLARLDTTPGSRRISSSPALTSGETEVQGSSLSCRGVSDNGCFQTERPD